MKTFIPFIQIQEQAALLIRNHAIKRNWFPQLPVPVELIAECTSNLDICRETLPPDIMGGLRVKNKEIVLNTTWEPKFSDNIGLERFTVAHELGHWCLHVNQSSIGQPGLPGLVETERFLCRNGDESPIEKQASMFAGALLLPLDLIREFISNKDLTEWRNLYILRDKANVSITAVIVRLCELGLVYWENGKLYHNKGECRGQGRLW